MLTKKPLALVVRMTARLVHQNRIHLVQRVDPPQKKKCFLCTFNRATSYQSKGIPSEETVVLLTTVCI